MTETTNTAPEARRDSSGQGKEMLGLLAGGITLVAGIVHLLVVEAHLTSARGSGLFFLGLGTVQILWAAVFLRQPTDRMARLGIAAMALAPTFLYILTRIMRAPWSFGPEHVDVMGLTTVVLQLAAAAALIAYLWQEFRATAPLTVGVALLLCAGAYGGALAVEDVDWLASAEVPHTHAAGDGSHAGHGGDAWGTVGQSIIGTVPYYGPADAQGIADYCRSKDAANQDCWLSFLKDLLVAEGSIPAFAELDALTVVERDANSQSHAMAHTLGHHAFQAYGRDIVLTLGECSYEVFQGCIHGALQAYFSDLAAEGQRLTSSNIANVCSAAETSFETYACIHGVGHGVMIYYDYAMDRSLDVCSAMGSSFDRASCYGGVYMENVVAYLDSQKPGYVPHHGDSAPDFWVDADDPAYPCNAVDNKYEASCWRMQTSLILYFNKGDFRAASAVCDEAGDYHLSCYASIGRDAKTYARSNPATMSQHCSYGTTAQQTECVRAFTAGVSLAANDVQAAIDLCPQLNDTYRVWCYMEVGDQGDSMLGAKGAEELCNSLPDEYQAPCHEGRK